MILSKAKAYEHERLPGTWRVVQCGVDTVTFVNADGGRMVMSVGAVLSGEMKETSMIEVKTGQRWRLNGRYGHGMQGGEFTVVRIDTPTSIVIAEQATRKRISLSKERLNTATLTYDPDEGEAPEVGSRWRRGCDVTYEVVRIQNEFDTGRPMAVAKVKDMVNLVSFAYLHTLCRLLDEPTDMERKPLLCAECGNVHPNAWSDDPSCQGWVCVPCTRRRIVEARTCKAVGCGGAAEPGCTACRRCQRMLPVARALTSAIAAFAKRAPVREPTRDELLEHWMSLRPDDLHEGGWRRVGVALVGEQGSTRSDLDTFSQWMNWEMRHPHSVIVEHIGHTPCMQNELRLYREEERRGKWWVS